MDKFIEEQNIILRVNVGVSEVIIRSLVNCHSVIEKYHVTLMEVSSLVSAHHQQIIK